MSYQFGHVDPEERLDHVEEPQGGDDDPPRRRLPPVVLAAGGVLALFVAGMCFAYYEGTKHATLTVASPAGAPGTAAAPAAEAVPLIHADPTPVKVKPEKAGGMVIPDKDDPLYALRPGGVPAEHILPPPEAPQPRPTAPQQLAAAPPPQAPPSPVQPVAVLPAPPQVPPLPRPVAKPPEAAKPAGPPTRVQLASLRTPEEARDEWARLKGDNADLLGKFSAVAVRADLGERGVWYRVEAGPVGDKEAAIRLCKALKERDLECQLVQ